MGGGETTPGKKIDPKNGFVSEIWSFLYYDMQMRFL